jgi:hypothetical protein
LRAAGLSGPVRRPPASRSAPSGPRNSLKSL